MNTRPNDPEPTPPHPPDGPERTGGVRAFGGLLAWGAAVAAATLVGVIAVGSIGDGILPPSSQPLGQDEVERRLAAPAPTDPVNTPTPTATPDPSSATPSVRPTQTATAPTRVIASPGGTIVARCGPGVEVVSTTPLQGFRVKDTEPEDGGIRVRFEAGEREVEVLLSCTGGRIHADIEDDSGDDGDDGGDDSGDDSGDDPGRDD